MLLLLDDLHTVSPATAALLGRLAQVPPPGLLWVTAYRPRQMPSHATAALAAGIHLSRRAVTLTPLDPASVAALLGLPEGRAAQRVHVLSGGMPRYVLAYRPGALDGPVAALRGLPAELPVDVTGAVQLDLDALSGDQRQMLEAVSVCPDGFEPTLAAALAGRGPEATSDLLDALVAVDLLRTDPSEASTLRFRHEVDRTVVYRALSPGRRRRLHATAATVLRDLGHPVTRYAEHLSASGQCAEAATADALIEAAESGLVPRLDAIRWLTNVQRLLPAAEVTEPRRTRLEFAMADALVGAGHLRQARTLLQELTRRPLGDCDQRLRALAARARVERLLGRPYDAYALLLPYQDERVGPHSQFLLTCEAAVAGVLCGSSDAAERARSLDVLAARTGEPVYATTAAVVQSFVAAYTDCGIGVRETLDRASAEVDAFADTDLARHPDLLALLGWAEYFHERERSALHHFDRALDICCRAGLVALTPWLLVGRCAVTARLGNLDRARAEGEDAEEVAVAMGIDPLVALARAYRAIAVAWRSGPAAARHLADTAVLDASTRRDNWYDGASQRVSVRLRFLAGDRAGSTSTLLRACGGDDLDQVEVSQPGVLGLGPGRDGPQGRPPGRGDTLVGRGGRVRAAAGAAGAERADPDRARPADPGGRPAARGGVGRGRGGHLRDAGLAPGGGVGAAGAGTGPVRGPGVGGGRGRARRDPPDRGACRLPAVAAVGGRRAESCGRGGGPPAGRGRRRGADPDASGVGHRPAGRGGCEQRRGGGPGVRDGQDGGGPPDPDLPQDRSVLAGWAGCAAGFRSGQGSWVCAPEKPI